ncbi:hypothetical protein DXG01_010498 [Tephrocybe rancida]|nr:hypothetical protein DXG01_010498 [Tephrocybe rancida]
MAKLETQHNDRLAIAFLHSAVAHEERWSLVTDKGARACYVELEKRGRKQMGIKQVALVSEAMSIRCSSSELLAKQGISGLVDRIVAHGEITPDMKTDKVDIACLLSG